MNGGSGDNMDKKIEQIRREIDRIDEELLGKLAERIRKTKKIGMVKKEAGRPVYDPAREALILQRLEKKAGKRVPAGSMRAIFQEIFSCCRALEEAITIAYLGPEATFTHQAAVKTFGPEAGYLPVKSVAAIFSAVEKKQAAYGVVPIENSTEGMVSHTLDMFIDSELKIVKEVMLPVRHHLLGPGELGEVRHVYSHPQAFGQCEKWLEENLSGVALHETDSTVVALKKIARLKNAAAIASETASLLHGVPIIARDIHDSTHNVTRFLVVGNHATEKSGRDRTSILFSIRDRVGALHDMLVPFSRQGLNLTRIESRPTKKRAWEYVFFVDFIGYREDPPVRKALGELEEMCLFLKVLGSYPVADGA